MPRKVKNKSLPAERLTTLRRSTGMTQEEFAEKSGIGLSSIKRLESGDLKPTESLKRKYVEYFECDPAYITGESKYRDRREQLLAERSDPDKRRSEFYVALNLWLEAELPGNEIDYIDSFAVLCEVTEYIRDQIAEAKKQIKAGLPPEDHTSAKLL